ncbi:MAG: hypothetical protein AB1644_03150 [Candidatus Zixiibacteriota bacterium]
MRLGFLGSGTGHINSQEQSLIPGFTFGAGMDFRIRPHWYWGVGFDVHRVYPFEIGQHMLDVSLGVKYMQIGKQSKVAFRPSLFFGYGRLAVVRTIDTTYLNPADFITFKGSLEVIFFSDMAAAFFAEVGVFEAFEGWDGRNRIRFGPTALLRAGVML